MKYPKCYVCGEKFDKYSWEERHSTPEGEDCHEECCSKCKFENVFEFAKQAYEEIAKAGSGILPKTIMVPSGMNPQYAADAIRRRLLKYRPTFNAGVSRIDNTQEIVVFKRHKPYEFNVHDRRRKKDNAISVQDQSKCTLTST